MRACLHVVGGHVALARRDELPAEPAGDLLQAGPLLVRHGAPCVGGDVEGFSAGPGQFDSDITAGRYPRAALASGAARARCWPWPATGAPTTRPGSRWPSWPRRSSPSAPHTALNLDGGGSTSLVCAGRLRNVPREDHGVVLAGGRPVSTVIAFMPR